MALLPESGRPDTPSDRLQARILDRRANRLNSEALGRPTRRPSPGRDRPCPLIILAL